MLIKFKNKTRDLHNSASQWFENNDQLVFALEHALAAGNKHKALDHFAKVINHLWETSQYQTILQFGGMFTHEEIIKNVDLSFNYFWILFQSGYMEQAESLISRLKEHTTDKGEIAMVYICMNNLKVSLGNIESAYSYSELALQHINKDVDYWNIFAFLSLGEVHLLRFELAESFQSFDKAAGRASVPHFIYFEMINRVRAYFVQGAMGDSSGAYKACKDLLSDFSA